MVIVGNSVVPVNWSPEPTSANWKIVLIVRVEVEQETSHHHPTGLTSWIRSGEGGVMCCTAASPPAAISIDVPAAAAYFGPADLDSTS